MDCEKCGSNMLVGMNSGRKIYDAVEYSLECMSCHHKWRKKKGARFSSIERREASKKEWENVSIVPNSFEQNLVDIEEKIKRGECPSCGKMLSSSPISEGQYKTRIGCSSGSCGFVRWTSEEYFNACNSTERESE